MTWNEALVLLQNTVRNCRYMRFREIHMVKVICLQSARVQLGYATITSLYKTEEEHRDVI